MTQEAQAVGDSTLRSVAKHNRHVARLMWLALLAVLGGIALGGFAGNQGTEQPDGSVDVSGIFAVLLLLAVLLIAGGAIALWLLSTRKVPTHSEIVSVRGKIKGMSTDLAQAGQTVDQLLGYVDRLDRFAEQLRLEQQALIDANDNRPVAARNIARLTGARGHKYDLLLLGAGAVSASWLTGCPARCCPSRRRTFTG